MKAFLTWTDHHFWLTVGLSLGLAFVLSQVWITFFVYCICGSMRGEKS